MNDDSGGSGPVVGDRRVVGQAIAEQEFESMKLLRTVDDGLSSEKDVFGYVLHGCY
jgi:hypothetical protein